MSYKVKIRIYVFIITEKSIDHFSILLEERKNAPTKGQTPPPPFLFQISNNLLTEMEDFK